MKLHRSIVAPPGALARLRDLEHVRATLPGCHTIVARKGEWIVSTDVQVASARGLWTATCAVIDPAPGEYAALHIRGAGAPGSFDGRVGFSHGDPVGVIVVDGEFDGAFTTVGASVLGASIERIVAALTAEPAALPRPVEASPAAPPRPAALTLVEPLAVDPAAVTLDSRATLAGTLAAVLTGAAGGVAAGVAIARARRNSRRNE